MKTTYNKQHAIDPMAYIAFLEQQLQEKTLLLQEQQALVNSLKETLQSKEDYIANLTEMLVKAQKTLFGQSSEKHRYQKQDESMQQTLFNEAEAEAQNNIAPLAETITVSSHKRKPKRSNEELMKELPVKRVMLDLPEEEQVCPVCQSALRLLGQEVVRREIEIIPEQVMVVEYVRNNYVCTACESESEDAMMVKPPCPPAVIKGGMASPSAVAYTMYQKYVNSMPLYRQEKAWAGKGFAISRATLANWVIAPAMQWLRPLYEQLHRALLSEAVIHADETEVQVLREENRAAKSDSWMWVYCSGGGSQKAIILYQYQPSRSGDRPQAFLKGFEGYLQSDGYAGYNKVEGVTQCGCWAHMRRKYKDALPSGGKKGSKAWEGYEYCNKLFALEQAYTKEKLDDEGRKAARGERSAEVLKAYWAWVETVKAPNGSKLAKAITYALNQRKSLERFLEDGRIELSNNRAENAIRPFVIGRKNWLFSNGVKGARASEIVYSLVETAKANGLNVYMYLYHVLSEMPKRVDGNGVLGSIDDLLPYSETLPAFCRIKADNNNNG